MSRKHIAVFLLCCCTIVASVIWIDVPVAWWIESHTTEWMRRLGSWLEEAGKAHWVLGYCLAVSLIAWRSMRSVAHKHLALFASVALSGIAANIIKVLACRSRPPLLIEHGIETWNLLGFNTEFLWNSFPSGHASTGLAIALTGSALYPQLRWMFWTVGLAIALGRIMLNVHYVSDVLAGGLLGVVVAMLVNNRLARVGETKVA